MLNINFPDKGSMEGLKAMVESIREYGKY